MVRNAVASLLAAVMLVTVSPAFAQDPPPEDPPEEEDPRKKAQRLFLEGVAAEEAQDYDTAIARFEAAYESFNDGNIYLRIGQAYQLKGNAGGPDFEAYKKAIEAYKKFKELIPLNDDSIDPIKAAHAEADSRISTLETAIKEEEDRVAQEKEDEKQRTIQEAKERREAAEREKRERAKLDGMRPAVDALVVAGLDTDTSLAARLIAGGFLGWGMFALEGHLAFEGLFPLASNKGTAARSLTLIDLGVRVGNGRKNFTGFFVSAGGGFGLFGGNPREKRIKDDPETCMGFGDVDDPDSCKFDVDKNITGRFGLGYGFAASGKTTVAARLDFTAWWLSVDGTQPNENVPAARVDKPNVGLSILLGLEFMRWM